ncbi:sulfur carrier protein ThiS [Massilia endophytica]|uniref:sulfur carrier protein ThiS n=1 Tax=Massilia endophytica TaxID=2899220 RepID=UPI001E556C04|nr:sulfur carrier protein ThiS [Massilia endophytica]UGQ47093.1 sulfur carrier protein ThiS [Massilia endophytica]
MIGIVLNGEPRSVPPGHDLQALIDGLELGGQALALAVNRQVVPRQKWPGYQLQAEDRIDIVRAIGGG